MKRVMLVFLLLGFTQFSFAEKTAPMPELQRPENIVIDQGQILITEFPNVYVYSLKDFSFIVKFGKAGEGPKEFFQYVRIQIDPDQPQYILVNSHMKMSYFTRDGKFVKEIRSKGDSAANVYKPVGENFVAYGQYRDEEAKKNYQTINLHDSNMKKIKTIYQCEQFFNPDRQVVHALNTWGAWFRIFDNKIFVKTNEGDTVKVFNAKGDHLYDITHTFEKLKVTDKDKARYHEYFRTDRRWKQFYEAMKTWIKFPSHFPIMRGMDVTGGHVYVNSYMRPDGTTEFTVFDLKGKLVKEKVYLRLQEISARDLYPYTIKEGNLYQLVEDEDEEMWRLHIHQIL